MSVDMGVSDTHKKDLQFIETAISWLPLNQSHCSYEPWSKFLIHSLVAL